MMNEHDLTKKMLSTMRKSINVITEIEENNSISLSGEEKKEEESKFRQVIGPIHFEDNSVILYPHDNNVIVRGAFTEGLTFEMSITDGVYITASSLLLSTTITGMITKLQGYYEVWKGEWIEKLPDYKNDLR